MKKKTKHTLKQRETFYELSYELGVLVLQCLSAKIHTTHTPNWDALDKEDKKLLLELIKIPLVSDRKIEESYIKKTLMQDDTDDVIS